jgi:hypothetical protein
MTMLGDFSAEKEHVLKVMDQRFALLKEDRTVSRLEIEQIIFTRMCSVFRYSASRVDWSTTKFDVITQSWIKAYEHTWSLPKYWVTSGQKKTEDEDALQQLTAEVLDMLEQCISLPGEI